MLKTGLAIFIETLTVLLAILCVEEARKQELSLVLALILAVGVAALLASVLNVVLLEWPIRWRWVRKLIEPAAAFEGHWIIWVKQLADSPYSYGRFRYDAYATSYVFEGYSFANDYAFKGYWRTNTVVVDLRNERIWYVYEAGFEQQKAQVSGYGWIRFTRTDSGQVSNGIGFFVDFGEKSPRSSRQYLERINPSTGICSDLEDVAGIQDARRLVKAYHKRAKHEKQSGRDPV